MATGVEASRSQPTSLRLVIRMRSGDADVISVLSGSSWPLASQGEDATSASIGDVVESLLGGGVETDPAMDPAVVLAADEVESISKASNEDEAIGILKSLGRPPGEAEAIAAILRSAGSVQALVTMLEGDGSRWVGGSVGWCRSTTDQLWSVDDLEAFWGGERVQVELVPTRRAILIDHLTAVLRGESSGE